MSSVLRITTALLSLGLAVAPATAAPTTTHLGSAFALSSVTPIVELTGHPERHFNRTVRIEGVIASCCTQEGCFIEVVPEGGGEGILVNFPDVAEHFPTDCIGRHAVVEGLFYRKIYPASRVQHWQGHSFRRGRVVPDYSVIPRLTATAATISGPAGAAPRDVEFVRARTDRVDLATMEFETDGFGAGRKQLAPGDSTETHGTGNSREIVLCLEGSITVRGVGPAPVVLGPGEMSFIPPGTLHALRNESDRPAVYVFVFARQIEEEKAHQH